MYAHISEKIQSLLDQQLPFLAFRNAGDTVLHVYQQLDDLWHKSKPDNMSYVVFCSFLDTDNQVFIINDVKHEFNCDLSTITNSIDASILTDHGYDSYSKLFNKAMHLLDSSILHKVVLSRKRNFKKQDSDTIIFERLLRAYPQANNYFFYHPKVGKWMGATPEVLLHINAGRAMAMSLAGTAVNDGSNTHLWGEKELEEQQIVTDYITSQFYNAGLTHIQTSKTQTVSAGHLLHLCTHITGQIDITQLDHLLHALHPTPAVCGLPVNIATQFINTNEGYNRSYYTGYLGIVNPDQHKYFVNLRCMQLYDHSVDIYVGGGVTAQSNLQDEYQETNNKMMTMYRLL